MQVREFQKKVFEYYDSKGRDLPWRKTTDSYKILLSEIMLQQTQVDRVIKYFEKWTEKWPTVKDLANAERKEVLQEWLGLGYNNRAIRLHKAAQKIVDVYNGNVIAAVSNYNTIPGIGPYTSAAVRIFSQNEDIVTVDTNIRRILIYEFNLSEKVSDKELWELAEKCLPKGKSCDWHNALMDYGATLLTARKTGIKPKTKQSKFKGSDREIRSKIVKLLMIEEEIEEEVLSKKYDEDRERIKRILEKMEKDDIIQKRSGKIVLVE